MIVNKDRFSIENILIESNLIDNKKDFITLDEDTKSKKIDVISAKLIKGIYKKFNNNYFSYIEASKGDITKLKDYKTLEDGIKLLDRTINNSKNVKPYIKNCIALIKESLNILENNKANFKKSFNSKNTVTSRYLYDSIVACIIEGTTGIISNYITFKRDNYNNLILDINNSDKDISNNNFFGSMKKFIDLNTNHKLIELFNFENKNINESSTLVLIGSVIGIGIAALVAFLLLIRVIVYAVFYIRIKIAEKLDEIKNLLVLNVSTLSGNPNNEKIIERQKKWIDKLEKYSDKIDVEHAVAQSKANNDITNENSEISKDTDNYDGDILI